jgi:NAD(P)-dependent dehydrogenase (short-subunit alcohol dehydrogenase family)
MRVVLADINDERLAEAVEEIRKADGEALAVHRDVTNDEDVAALHRAALESFDPVDLVMSLLSSLLPRQHVLSVIAIRNGRWRTTKAARLTEFGSLLSTG